MRSLFVYALLLGFFVGTAQTGEATAPKFGIVVSPDFDSITFSDALFESTKQDRPLLLYNRTTGSYEQFYGNQTKFTAGSASLLGENQFRNIKIDSFNPNGACNFGEALGAGLLNLLLRGNSGFSIYNR